MERLLFDRWRNDENEIEKEKGTKQYKKKKKIFYGYIRMKIRKIK